MNYFKLLDDTVCLRGGRFLVSAWQSFSFGNKNHIMDLTHGSCGTACKSFSFLARRLQDVGTVINVDDLTKRCKIFYSPFQLQITASVQERALHAILALLLWPTRLAAAVCEQTMLFVTERGLN